MKSFPTFLLLGASLALCACGPDLNAVANRLREDNLKQKRDLTTLQEKLKSRDAQIADLQNQLRGNVPPLNTLPPERMNELFTAVKMEIRNQTNVEDLGSGQRGFRVFLRLYTDDAQLVPAAGELTLEVFDLPAAPAEAQRLGTWKFTAAEMKKNWYTSLGSNHFAFNCPFQTPIPANVGDLTFKAHFRDALTGRTLEAELTRKVNR